MKQLQTSILIIRRDNIGDLILTTPLFQAIRQKYPNCYLAVLANSYNAPVIEGNPYLDDIFTYTKGKHSDRSLLASYGRKLGLLWRLRQKQFDYVLLPNGGVAARALTLARMISPRQIIGFVDEHTHSQSIHLPVDYGAGQHLHETEDIFRLLEPLGISGTIPKPTVIPDTSLIDTLRATLPSAVLDNTGGPLVAMHLSARKERQRWPAEYFVQLARLLHTRFNARFLIFWSPGDESNPFHPGDDRKAQYVLGMLSDIPAAPVPTTDVSVLIAGMSLVDYAVLSDGGAMHIAAGLGKPIVCFFGNSSAIRWHPWGVPYELLQKSSQDVSDITVAEAVEAFSRLAEKYQPQKKTKFVRSDQPGGYPLINSE